MTFAKIMREKGIEPSCPERAPDPKTRARPPTRDGQGCSDTLESAGIGTNQPVDVTKSVTPLNAGKFCKACGEVKPVSEFNKHRVDGKGYLQAYCRPCHAQKERERYANSPSCREQIARRDRKVLDEKRHVLYAQGKVYRAVKRGLLQRGPCESEGPECRGQIQAHHDDYSRPLDVRWVCRKHHVDADRARRALERAA